MNNDWKKYAKDIFPDEFQKFESLNYTGSNSDTEVRFGVTMLDDVLRRDFTINALFYDINKHKVIDLVGGINDLRSGIIKCVGNPVLRFEEDNLRKLRAIRFASRLDFEIEEFTLKAIQENPTLNVTYERIYNELVVMYSTAQLNEYLTFLLFKSKLMQHIIPNVEFIDTILPEHMTKSFSTWIAGLCRKSHDKDIKSILIERKFPTIVCNNVDFLLKYCLYLKDAEIRDIEPLVFHRQWKSCSLFVEEILDFGSNQKYLKYLVNFKPSTEITKKFQEEGYIGKKLGEVLNQHYKLKYLTAISHK